MFRTIAIVASATTLASCTHVIWVKEKKTISTDEPKAVYGIPFHVKVEKFRQTTVYADTWLRATLNVEKKLVDTATGKEVLIESGEQQYTRDIANPPPEALNDIKQKLLTSSTAEQSVADEVIALFRDLPAVDKSKPINPRVTKNTVEPEWVVDSTHTYYLNAPLPWFGSGNLTQELNPDGTLAKASSAPDTKIADGLSSLIPFKEFLTGKFVKPAPAAAKDSEAKSTDIATGLFEFKLDDPKATLATKKYVYALSLSIVETGYEYTLTSQPQDTQITDLTPIKFTDIAKPPANFSRKSIGGEGDDEKKDEGQSVGISGKVSFPKDWGAAPKPKE